MFETRLDNLNFLRKRQCCGSQACGCSFLFFAQDLLRLALRETFARPQEAAKLPLLVAAFMDAHALLDHVTGDGTLAHKVLSVPNYYKSFQFLIVDLQGTLF